jgi:hypothetical protein
VHVCCAASFVDFNENIERNTFECLCAAWVAAHVNACVAIAHSRLIHHDCTHKDIKECYYQKRLFYISSDAQGVSHSLFFNSGHLRSTKRAFFELMNEASLFSRIVINIQSKLYLNSILKSK